MTIVLVPSGLLAQAVRGGPPPDWMKRLYYRVACRIAGIRVETRGEVMRHQAVLFVANHVSYIDIPAIGTEIDVNFIAKAEVADWPLFGLLAKLAGTIFIARERRQVAAQHVELEALLARGHALFLFPEGTSTPGREVLPFKSSLMGIAGARAALVQPVSVAYRDPKADYAWYGDMTLLPHLAHILGLPGVTVLLTFHPPVDSAAFASRKALTLHLQQSVAAGLDAAIAGLPPLREAPGGVAAPAAADAGG